MSTYRSRSYSGKKSRYDIEKEASERYHAKHDMSQNIDPSGYGITGLPIPAFLNVIPIIDFDQYSGQNEEVYLSKRAGDFPLESMESERSLHDDS